MKESRYTFIYSALLLLFLVPTFLLNNNRSHDWGDDFAQYIHQAKQIKNTEIHGNKVINIDAYGSDKRGILFSAVLSLVPDKKGVQPYLEIVFVFFIFSSIAVFIFFCRYFSPLLSFLLTLGVYLNYHVIQLKETVMSEFAFMLLLYFILRWTERQKDKPLLTGLLFSLLCGFRIIGLVFYISYIIYELLQKNTVLKERIIKISKNMLSFTFALLVLQFLIFPHHQNREISFFSDVVSTRLNIQSLMENIREYAIHFQLLFEQELPHWLNLLLFYTTLFFLIAGFIRAFRKGIDFKLLALFSYLLFLLIYPYNGACIRFLIPVLPLILFYVTEGIVSVISLIRYPNAITASFIFLLLLSNAKTLWLDARQNKNEFGPYNASIQNDFRTIDKTVPADAVIAFSKPFVINLFCKRDAFYDNKNNIADIKNKADYVLLVTDERLDEVYIPESFLPVTGTDTLELEHFLLIKTH